MLCSLTRIALQPLLLDQQPAPLDIQRLTRYTPDRYALLPGLSYALYYPAEPMRYIRCIQQVK